MKEIKNNHEAMVLMRRGFKIANKALTRSPERAREVRAVAKRIFNAVEAWDKKNTPQP